MDDDFWNTYYPPNGYNCRCTVVQTSERTTRLGMDKPLPIPKLFEVNLAKKKYMFPPNHPYFERAKGRITSEILAALPVESSYIDVTLPKSDTTIKVSAMQTDDEIVKNIEVARILAENGYKDIKLLPNFNSKVSPQMKQRFYPEGQMPENGQNADAIIDGNVYEIKVCGNKKFVKNLNHALDQARRSVIQITDTPLTNAKYRLENVIKEYDEIIIIQPDGSIEYY